MVDEKSPFDEIFKGSNNEKKEEKDKKDFFHFGGPEESKQENASSENLDTYLSLLKELISNKYYFEAIEIIKEIAQKFPQ